MVKKKPKILWFARAGDISRMGPYPTQLRACEGVKGHDGNPVPDALIWCESEADYKKYQKKMKEVIRGWIKALP